MLRWILPLAIALSAISPADAADGPVVAKSPTVKAARQLPAGLPRRHYAYRTTITGPAYVRRGRQLVVVEPKVIPLNSEPYIPFVRGEPLLPGSSSLPGYYGNSRSYRYLGPYYGGAYVDYWDRLPYACGVYGYC
ncbi:3D (Asp-Asp-Asp) domain-containing protein [Bradyrhizobium sp. USDA 4461]